jgi:hypothetical protein
MYEMELHFHKQFQEFHIYSVLDIPLLLHDITEKHNFCMELDKLMGLELYFHSFFTNLLQL